MEQTTTTTPAPAPAPVEAERPHHPFSPSSLQNREACPCFRNRGGTSVAAETGSKQHKLVETGEDDHTLGDDKAAAAAECLDFYYREKLLFEEARNRETQRRIAEAQRAGEVSYLPPAEIVDVAEIYLKVDCEKFAVNIGGKLVEFEGTTAGYPDRVLVSWDRKSALILDWKFGAWAVEEAENNLQGIAYCLGLFRAIPVLESIRFVFKQPHLNYTTEHVFRRSDVPANYLRVQTVVARAREALEQTERGDFSMATPRVPACNFCGLLGKCPKVAEYALKVGEKFSKIEFPKDFNPTGFKTEEDRVNGLRLAQVVACWASAYKTQITDRMIRDAGTTGVMVPPPGYRVETRRDRELADTAKLREVALHYMTEAELLELAQWTFGSLEELINDRAPRGSKAARVEEFKQALLDSGAVKLGDPYSFLRAVSSTPRKKSDKTATEEAAE